MGLFAIIPMAQGLRTLTSVVAPVVQRAFAPAGVQAAVSQVSFGRLATQGVVATGAVALGSGKVPFEVSNPLHKATLHPYGVQSTHVASAVARASSLPSGSILAHAMDGSAFKGDSISFSGHLNQLHAVGKILQPWNPLALAQPMMGLWHGGRSIGTEGYQANAPKIEVPATEIGSDRSRLPFIEEFPVVPNDKAMVSGGYGGRIELPSVPGRAMHQPDALDGVLRSQSAEDGRAPAHTAGAKPVALPLWTARTAPPTYHLPHDPAIGEIIRLEDTDTFVRVEHKGDNFQPYLVPVDGSFYQLTMRGRTQLLPAKNQTIPLDRAMDYFDRVRDFEVGPGGINRARGKDHEPDLVAHVQYKDGKIVARSNVFINDHLLPRSDNRLGWVGPGQGVERGAQAHARVFEIVRKPSGEYVLRDAQGLKNWPMVIMQSLRSMDACIQPIPQSTRT
ncbi:MAG TPA: hypothetical protein PLQ67_07095 [Burkholderiaceae bacterium]|nr:hypothetical protein [Burkholderiaceae bacterium]